MSSILKILGQIEITSASTEHDLYECVSQNTVISTLFACNRGVDVSDFTVSISKGGTSTTNKDYIYYNVPIAGNDTFAATVGFTLSTGDKIRVKSSSTLLTFSIFGQEIN